MAKKKISKYGGYFSWAIFNGLILGILSTHGQDISRFGILSTILKELNQGISIPGIFWLQFFIFILGVVSLAFEVYIIWQEGLGVRIMTISAFSGIFLLVLGTGFNAGFIQNIGVILLIISILFEGYLIASER